MSPDPLDRLPEFFAQVQTRLLAGRREYGDRSFSAEPRQLLEEISQELLDTAAWSFILYERLASARQALRDVSFGAGNGGPLRSQFASVAVSPLAAAGLVVVQGGPIRKVETCCNLKPMEQSAPKSHAQLEDFAKFRHSSMCLMNVPDRLPDVDLKDAELVVLARRVAGIVLSACDEDDLHQALDEAYSCYESIDRPVAQGLSIHAYVRDPEVPIEIREWMLASFFGHIARLTLLVIDADRPDTPQWLKVALRRYVEIGIDADAQWAKMTDQDLQVFNERQLAGEKVLEELSRRAAKSGQDVFCPFGNPDD